MKNIAIIIALTLISGVTISVLYASQPGWEWAMQSSDVTGTTTSIKTATDNNNNLITIEYCHGYRFMGNTVLVSNNPNSMYYSYIHKQDSNANTIFIKTFDYQRIYAQDIKTDIYDNIYLQAAFYHPTIQFEGTTLSSDAGQSIIAKFDPLGNLLWVKQYTFGNLYVSATGICYIAGSFSNTLQFNGLTYISRGSTDFLIAKLSSDLEWAFVKQIGGNQADAFDDITFTSNGGIYLVGLFQNTCNWGTGQNPVYIPYGRSVVRLNPLGGVVWSKKVENDYYAVKSSNLAIDSQNNALVVVQYSQNTSRYIKLQRFQYSNGDKTSLFQSPNGPLLEPKHLRLDNLDNAYMTGKYSQPFTIGNFGYMHSYGDFFIKLNSSGAVLWAYDSGSESSISAPRFSRMTVNNSGAYLSFSTYEPTSVPPFQTYNDLGSYTLQFTSAGVPVRLISNWINVIGSEAKDLALNADGSCYIAGVFNGDSFWKKFVLRNKGIRGSDIFIVKLGADRVVKWAASAGSTDTDFISSITSGDDNSCYITGKFYNTIHFGNITLTSSGQSDIYVAKLDSLGNWQWAVSLGGEGEDEGHDITAKDGNVYLCGKYSGTVNFQTIHLSSMGTSDAFVQILSPSGTFLHAFSSHLEDDNYSSSIAVDNLSRIWLGITSTHASSIPDYPPLLSFTLDLYSASRQLLFTSSSNSDADCSITKIGLDNENNCFIVGSRVSEIALGDLILPNFDRKSIFVAKASSNLHWLWLISAEAENDIAVNDLFVSPAGDCYLAGMIQGTGTFGSILSPIRGGKDALFSKISGEGVWSWVKVNGSPQDDQAASILWNANNQGIATGYVSSPGYFDTNYITPRNLYETFIGTLSYSVGNEDTYSPSIQGSTLTTYPNPFSHTLNISYDSKVAEPIEIRIYNIRGQLVRKLQSSASKQGINTFTWDGLNDKHHRSAPGIYFVKLSTQHSAITRKVIRY